MATVIGQRIPRVEGAEKVTGEAQYSADVILPGMVWGKTLRSPYPYARVKSIDTGRAKALPGVLAVITGKDIKNSFVGRRLRDQHILADDMVRFIGEKVAAVAAEEKDVAEAALELIEVEYEQLEGVFDPLEATGEKAPVLHPKLQTYTGLAPVPEHLKNVQSCSAISKGDVQAGFAEAEEIVEGTYSSAMIHQGYIEPNAAMVSIDPDGKVHVWSSQKQPWGSRDMLAEALGLSKEQVVYEYIRVGAEFGGKGALFDTPLCYWLARATGRPVKMVMTYTEELIAANPRHPSYIRFKTGVTRDGTITAHEAQVIYDGGAYGAYKPVPGIDLGGARKAGGAYRIPNIKIDTFIVYTNHVPGGFMRAPGDPQVMFALESHVDEIAYKLGMDPLEFRHHNILREGDENAVGVRWEDLRIREVLDAAAAASNYGKPKSKPNIGRGIALAHRHIGGGNSEALIRIDSQGEATIVTGTPDAGQGSHTIQRQIVSDLLTIPLDRVHVIVGNTDTAPFDSGIAGGKTTHVTGQAIVGATRKVIAELRPWAAEIRGWQESTIELAAGAFYSSGEPGEPVTLRMAAAEAIRRKGEPLEFRASYANTHVDQECAAAQVAEVEVDRETGQVTVLSISAAHDSGTLINPMAAEGQIEGGVIQGFGFGAMEEIILEDGKVANPNLGEYKLPTIRDVPEIKLSFIEDAPGPLPYNGRAISEHSLIVTAAAIANAVRDAVGVRITSTPITAEKVFQALKAKASR